jgi:hypothetical protein
MWNEIKKDLFEPSVILALGAVAGIVFGFIWVMSLFPGNI